MTPIKFSLWPNPSWEPTEVFERARWADRSGWFGLWFADHYMPNTGDTSFAPGDYYECWGLIPAVAAVTERIRVGPLVSPTSVHHPALLANRAATIDRLSNGRMVLGIGAGWQINEHTAYGIELEAPEPRVTRFGEAIEIIRSLLTNQRTSYHGTVYSISDAPCDPKPVQSPLPILVGTGSARMLGYTARFADEWNTWGDVDLASERRELFVAACERAGVDPADKHTSVNALVVLDGDRSKTDETTIAGSAEALIDTFGRYRSAGFDEFVLPAWNVGATATERAERLQQLHDDVFAKLT